MRIICVIGVLLCASVCAAAQTLERGDNEFGFWAGFSPKATTIFEGLREDEAENRKFFLAAFRYGRTLAANDTLAFQWTVDAVPVAVATGTGSKSVYTSARTISSCPSAERARCSPRGETTKGPLNVATLAGPPSAVAVNEMSRGVTPSFWMATNEALPGTMVSVRLSSFR